jgi:hypothetical protein
MTGSRPLAGGPGLARLRADRLAGQARRTAETARDCEAAVQEAEAHAKQAWGLQDDPPRWQAALAAALSAARRAEGVLRTGLSTEAQQAQVSALEARLEQQERDRQLVAELEESRRRTG